MAYTRYSIYAVVRKKPDFCYIFKQLEQILVYINNFQCRESAQRVSNVCTCKLSFYTMGYRLRLTTRKRLHYCIQKNGSVRYCNRKQQQFRIQLKIDVIGNLSSRIDMQTHAGSTLHNPVTLTFDLLTSGSMHTEVLSVPCSVWIARVVFLLERGHTRSQTPRIGYGRHG